MVKPHVEFCAVPMRLHPTPNDPAPNLFSSSIHPHTIRPPLALRLMPLQGPIRSTLRPRRRKDPALHSAPHLYKAVLPSPGHITRCFGLAPSFPARLLRGPRGRSAEKESTNTRGLLEGLTELKELREGEEAHPLPTAVTCSI